MSSVKIILASTSPRRREMLTQLGIEYTAAAPDVDETPLPSESPQEMVLRLAEAKAALVAASNPGAIVIGADTTVVVAGENLGKPRDKAEAAEMLSKIQGTTHTVATAFSVNMKRSGEPAIIHSELHETEVTMVAMSAAEIAAYVETGEPLDKAGAYAIQGVGAGLIERINGSYTNVVGLNLSALLAALKKFQTSF